MPVNIINKFCPKCNTRKPRKEFVLNKVRHDGLSSYCRKCSYIYLQERRWKKDKTIRPSDIVRFFKHVHKTDRCWLWTGRKLPKGYGLFSLNYSPILAHRFAFLLEHGILDDALDVLHHCDTPSCVNPVCLFQGTNQDNVDDMVRKGRNIKGEQVPASKLQNKQVLTIRKKYKEGASQTNIAQQYNVSRSNIGFIVNRQTWKHL